LLWIQPLGTLLGENYLLLIAIFVMAGISAVCSGYEAAFFTLTRSNEVESLFKGWRERQANHQRNNPQRLLATLLLTNSLVNIGIVMVMAFVLARAQSLMGGEEWLWTAFELVVVSAIILIFCEVMPKVYAAQQPRRYVQFALPIIYAFERIVYPLSWLMARATHRLYARVPDGQRRVTVEELHQAIDLTSDTEAPPEEKELLKSIVKLDHISVKAVMRSRVDVVSVEINDTEEEVLNVLLTSGYSRLLVCEEDLDNIKGILYLKDFLQWQEAGKPTPWTEIIKPVIYVPENKKLGRLFKQFKMQRLHMAVVADEYGGTSGLITLQDVLEVIFGEPGAEAETHRKLGEQEYSMAGRTTLMDVCRILQIEEDAFDTYKGESETLAGMLLEISGKFPVQGEIFQVPPYELSAEEVSNKGIQRVRIRIVGT
jgi:putative hemolysin